MSYVELSNIGKSFDRVEVLKNINLSIKKDEFCVLVGPSGCGKSTLLRIIAGLENPSTGTLHIENNDVTDLRPRDRNIAMVFQNYAIYPHLTVRKNMEFGLKLDKTPKEKINFLVNEAAEILKLEPYLNRYPKQLSGGQRQRVGIARALYRKSKILVFDEATSSLDVETEKAIVDCIENLDGKVTLIVITHRLQTLRNFKNIYFIKQGLITNHGTYKEIIENKNIYKN